MGWTSLLFIAFCFQVHALFNQKTRRRALYDKISCKQWRRHQGGRGGPGTPQRPNQGIPLMYSRAHYLATSLLFGSLKPLIFSIAHDRTPHCLLLLSFSSSTWAERLCGWAARRTLAVWPSGQRAAGTGQDRTTSSCPPPSTRRPGR
jgi:hypothetical protein